MSTKRTYTVSGREVVVVEHEGGWTLHCGDRSVEHRYLDRALVQVLGGTSNEATRLAAEILRRPEGGVIE